MENQTNLQQQRQFKLAELKRLGYDPYPRKFDYSHTLGQIRRAFDASSAEELQGKNEIVHVCGRIMSMRPQGKAGFIDISDGDHRLQVYVRKDAVGAENFDLYRLFDIGDIIGAEGPIFRTRMNELTVAATCVHHLAKNLLPLACRTTATSALSQCIGQRGRAFSGTAIAATK